MPASGLLGCQSHLGHLPRLPLATTVVLPAELTVWELRVTVVASMYSFLSVGLTESDGQGEAVF